MPLAEPSVSSSPAAGVFSLEIDLGGRAARGSVASISTSGLSVLFRAEVAECLRPGTALAGARLSTAASDQVLPLLCVEQRVGEANGARVELRAEDDATRVTLWRARLEQAAGVRAATGRFFSPEALPRVPKRGVYDEAARLERLAFLRATTGVDLQWLSHTTLRPDRLTGNIENLVGGVEVPVGIAGPLWFRGEKARGLLYAPLATTEGALVASATRGALAFSRAGGVMTRVIRQQMARVPLFVFSGLRGALRFADFVRDHLEELREQTGKVSQHARLLSAEPALLGHMVNVCFLYETGDAAGQNMTTSCTWHACQWLLRQMPHMGGVVLENFLVEGAMSGDKKVTFQSLIAGRGTRVTAEGLLDKKTLERVLHVSPEQLMQAHLRGLAGSVQVGMVGYNVNVANIVAALFVATGQDVACVHESSLGQLHLEPTADGIYASLLLPSLIVGTVGGGTHLPRQNECLQIMDCAGVSRSARLAEIVAGFCLATDLSTMAAIAGGQFASAHDRLGRNRPVRFFTREDLTPEFFTPGLRRVLGDEDARVLSALVQETEAMGSIVTELTARRVRKLVGLFPCHLRYLSARGAGEREVMVKSKPLDAEVILAGAGVAALCGPRLRSSFARFKDRLGLLGVHTRELGVYRQTDPRFLRHRPALYEAFRDDEREAYVLVLEHLRGLHLLNAVDQGMTYDRAAVEAALLGIAEVHAIWYAREEELRLVDWLASSPSAASMAEMSELFEDLGVHAAQEFPEWVSEEDLALHHELVHSLPDWWGRIEALPRTLIHNDFNPRNLAFRREGADLRLCAWDWELATLHLPQHDLAELLAWVLTPEATAEEVAHYLEVHRRALERAAGRSVDPRLWREGYALSLRDLAVNRMALLVMVHTFRHYGFTERVVRTLRRLIALELGK